MSVLTDSRCLNEKLAKFAGGAPRVGATSRTAETFVTVKVGTGEGSGPGSVAAGEQSSAARAFAEIKSKSKGNPKVRFQIFTIRPLKDHNTIVF
jgi:hypothetical protein